MSWIIWWITRNKGLEGLENRNYYEKRACFHEFSEFLKIQVCICCLHHSFNLSRLRCKVTKEVRAYYYQGNFVLFAVVFDYLTLFYYHLHRKIGFAEIFFFVFFKQHPTIPLILCFLCFCFICNFKRFSIRNRFILCCKLATFYYVTLTL